MKIQSLLIAPEGIEINIIRKNRLFQRINLIAPEGIECYTDVLTVFQCLLLIAPEGIEMIEGLV